MSLRRSAPDPQLLSLFEESGRNVQRSALLLRDLLSDYPEQAARMGEHGRARAQEMRRRLRPLVAELVARAQEHGDLRSDFTPQDIALLFWGSDRVIELAGDVAPELWRRQLTFVLDGLRSATPTPLPAPPLTDAQLRRVGAKRGRTSA